jgi:amino acid transporter
MAASAFVTAQQLQGLIALNIPSYSIEEWHTALFTVAIAVVAIFCNTTLFRLLRAAEFVGLMLHCLGFLAILLVLWVMAPRSDPKTVWTTFQDNSGWGNTGLSTLVGILGPILTLIGSDGPIHLAEELKSASKVLPKPMVSTSVFNYALGFIMTFTIMSTLGDDIDGILASQFGQPWIQVVFNATGSRTVTSILTAVVCIQFLLCSVNAITTSSRQLFAFARDRGLPFSRFLSPVGSFPLSSAIH